MVVSGNTFDEKSGLLWSGKRYKRYFGSYSQGQHTDYSPANPIDSEPEETPYVGNPPVTPQRRPIIPENPLQSESHPSPSIPVVGYSTPVSSPHLLPVPLQPPLDPLWTTCTMTLSYLFSKELDQRIQNSSGFYVKQCGLLRPLRIKIQKERSWLLCSETVLWLGSWSFPALRTMHWLI